MEPDEIDTPEIKYVIISAPKSTESLSRSLEILKDLANMMTLPWREDDASELCAMDIMAIAPYQTDKISKFAGFRDFIDMTNFVQQYGLKEIYKELLPNEYTQDYIRIKRLFDNHCTIN